MEHNEDKINNVKNSTNALKNVFTYGSLMYPEVIYKLVRNRY
jgi:hypothetical protein